MIRKASSLRKEFMNFDTNEFVVEVKNDSGHTRDLSHGLETDSSVVERWFISGQDPLSARVEIDWKQELARDEWKIFTSAQLKVTCCKDRFYLTASISASEDNKNDLSEPPQLFSDEDNLNTSSENNQDEVFKNEDEEEFEIPAFLRKQKF